MKEKQQWLGLYEDEARWLRGLVERCRHADWREGGDDLMVEILARRMDNFLLVYPRRRPTKKKEDK
jgi:hypothetical protein